MRSIRIEGYELSQELQELIHLIYLPNLHEFSGSNIVAYASAYETFQRSQAPCSRAGSRVKYVHFEESVISTEALFEFIRPMSELQILTCSEYSPPAGESPILNESVVMNDFLEIADEWLCERKLVVLYEAITSDKGPVFKIRKIEDGEIQQQSRPLDV